LQLSFLFAAEQGIHKNRKGGGEDFLFFSSYMATYTNAHIDQVLATFDKVKHLLGADN
jgi:hypothetical protein